MTASEGSTRLPSSPEPAPVLHPEDLARLTAFRHARHRTPEVSGTEAATAQAVLDATVITSPDAVLTGLGGHGVALVHDSRRDGPTVMLRAELDALPIQERATHAHASAHPGRAHLCGHDGHMAILTGMAAHLSRRPPARGRVVLLFQPAEETGAGAAAVRADPRWPQIAPDWAFALHNMPGMALGAVAVARGPAHCASVGLRVRLTGRTAHAATPETGRSPAPCAARLVQALPGLAETDAWLTLCHLRVGDPAFGIAPGEAELWLTLRAVTDTGLKTLETAVQARIDAAATACGLTHSLTRHDHFPACTNHPDAVAVLDRAARAAGLPQGQTDLPMRASEDFGHFGHDARAAMALIGAGERCAALHSPDYDFPDALIAPGVALFAAIIDELLA